MKLKYLFLGIFLIPLVVNVQSYYPYTLSKMIWFFTFTIIGILIYAISALQSKTIIVNYNRKISLYLLFFLLSLLISTIFSIAPVQSYFGDFQNFNGVITFALLITNFLFLILVLNKDKKVILDTILWVGIILSLHSILQFLNADPLIHGNSDMFLGRVFATVGQPNFLAQVLIFPLFITFYQLIDRYKKDNYGQIFYILSLILISLALYLTKSRAVIIGIVVALAFWIFKKLKIRTIHKIIIAISAFFLLAVVIFTINPDFRSWNSRIILWQNTLQTSFNPIVGNGLNSYYQTIQTTLSKEIFQYENMGDIPARPHNDILEILVERGLLGLLFYGIMIGFLAKIYLQNDFKAKEVNITFFAIIAYLISLQFSFPTIDTWVYFIGFMSILVMQTMKFTDKKYNLLFKGKAIFVLLVGLSVIIFSNFLLIHVKADKYIAEGLNKNSFVIYSKAINAVPFYAEPIETIFMLFENAPDADKYLNLYGYITNYDFKYALEAGNYDSATMKAPNYPIIYLEAGKFAYENKYYLEAIEQFEKLRNLFPPILTERPITDEQKTKHRIFLKNNSTLFEGLKMLRESYRNEGAELKAKEIAELLENF